MEVVMPAHPLSLAAYLALAFGFSAEASSVRVGDRVLVNGLAERKCSGRVEALPAPGRARVSLDQPSCGDSTSPRSLKSLQRLSLVNEAAGLHKGDTVMVEGHFSARCAGRVKELSRSGYAAVVLDSFLCADAERLLRASRLSPVRFVDVSELGGKRFEPGLQVRARGLDPEESCQGEIRKVTSDGFALVDFDGLTCAAPGRFYPLAELQPVLEGRARRPSGPAIFERMMREIASSRAGSKKGGNRTAQ